jgi:hypothetical protein
MPDEWSWNSDWSGDGKDEFEQRLRRAKRLDRPHYLRIKALVLIGQGGAAEAGAANELLRRVIEDYPESPVVVMSHEHLCELDVREGDRRAAEGHYREALRLAPVRYVPGYAALRLSELLIDAGGAARA